MTPTVYSPAGSVTAPALTSAESFSEGRRGVTNSPTLALSAWASFAGVVLYASVASAPPGSAQVMVLLKCGWASETLGAATTTSTIRIATNLFTENLLALGWSPSSEDATIIAECNLSHTRRSFASDSRPTSIGFHDWKSPRPISLQPRSSRSSWEREEARPRSFSPGGPPGFATTGASGRFPAAASSAGETAVATALRELHEEVGVDVGRRERPRSSRRLRDPVGIPNHAARGLGPSERWRSRPIRRKSRPPISCLFARFIRCRHESSTVPTRRGRSLRFRSRVPRPSSTRPRRR